MISCAPLEQQQASELCREKGIFLHHITQWKQDFVDGSAITEKANIRSENKALRQDNKVLQKEISRKNKALAETAALLVLQKKVSAIWGNVEDNLL
ncbi:Mobile element protein [uncultured Candidatus Thioglobus sp.]|nr:Mobile element protein [uncultured Candidatus Thioglobus sp.]